VNPLPSISSTGWSHLASRGVERATKSEPKHVLPGNVGGIIEKASTKGAYLEFGDSGYTISGFEFKVEGFVIRIYC